MSLSWFEPTVGLHQTGTFEGRSTNWATAPRLKRNTWICRPYALGNIAARSEVFDEPFICLVLANAAVLASVEVDAVDEARFVLLGKVFKYSCPWKPLFSFSLNHLFLPLKDNGRSTLLPWLLNGSTKLSYPNLVIMTTKALAERHRVNNLFILKTHCRPRLILTNHLEAQVISWFHKNHLPIALVTSSI